MLFQFHKGTIKTFKIRPSLLNPILFQFHKGTIKTVRATSLLATHLISIP